MMTADTVGSDANKQPAAKAQLMAIFGAGVVGGVDAIGFAVASATLFFAGNLSSGVGMAAGVCLLSSFIVCVCVAWRSEIRCNVAQIQDMGVAVLTGTLATTAAQMQAGDDSRVATAFAIIAMSSLATGILMCATGWLRAGRIVRYFPLEVLAGFMAGTGWLLASGSMATMTSGSLGLDGWLELRHAGTFLAFLPALLFGCAVYACMNLFSHPITLLAVLSAGIGAFYVWLFATGGTIESAAAAGLLPTVGVEATLQLPFQSMFDLVDWNVVTIAVPAIVTIAILSLFAALMNTSALEQASGREAHMDDELKTTGYANTAAAFIGGPPGYSDLTISMLATKLGAKARGTGFVMAAVLLIGFVFTKELVSHIPVFISAGLILYFGIDLMKDWLIDTYKRFSLREWGVVVLILVVVACYGFLLAIIAGFLIATILFAYSYANTPVIRSAMSLADLPSSTERSAAETGYLSETGHGVKILQLQGFLFFGTTEQVLAQIRPSIEKHSGPKLQSIIINFRRVTNIDSGSAAAFQRVQTLAKRHGFRLILCGMSNDAREVLKRSGMSFEYVAFQAKHRGGWFSNACTAFC
jgi:SulP family sulfate permease